MKTFSFHFVSCYSREQVVSSSSLGNSSDFDAIVLSKGSAVYVQTAPAEVQPALRALGNIVTGPDRPRLRIQPRENGKAVQFNLFIVSR